MVSVVALNYYFRYKIILYVLHTLLFQKYVQSNLQQKKTKKKKKTVLSGR
jgi:hypothetical protein